jgi:hypothetical protein
MDEQEAHKLHSLLTKYHEGARAKRVRTQLLLYACWKGYTA